MKVAVDLHKCGGIGMCEMLAPEVFEVTDDGQARVLVSDIAPEAATAAHDAVASCPTGALSIVQP